MVVVLKCGSDLWWFVEGRVIGTLGSGRDCFEGGTLGSGGDCFEGGTFGSRILGVRHEGGSGGIVEMMCSVVG